MSPLLVEAGGILIAAATLGVAVYAAAVWWRTHDDPLGGQDTRREWPLLWVLGIVLLSRLWTLGVGSAGAYLHIRGDWPQITFPELWNRWDAPHYLDIARDGYQTEGDPRYFIVFYPLYPWLVRGAGWAFGDMFWAAMAVSNSCFFAACVLLYRLFRMDMDADSAGWGVVYLCFSPLAFFMSIPYTESLYLLLTVAFFYAAKKEKWLWAGGSGVFGGHEPQFRGAAAGPLNGIRDREMAAAGEEGLVGHRGELSVDPGGAVFVSMRQ